MSDPSDLRDLYQEVILDHGRHPRNRRVMANRSHMARSENPSCGDEVVVSLEIDNRGVIRDVAFGGQSCAIATASASLMTEVLVGKTPAQAKSLFDRFHALAAGGVEPPLDGMDAERERLAMLSGVRDYPVRVKCATLAWHTMLAALENQGA
ncbi:MAG: Fe-S cluster assembly sulfur transfer protein SufU [Bryobacteraceae bacterium]|jgi:nitrogen fixation NifU-like protein